MKAPTTILGTRLLHIIKERGTSMRKVSLDAGLSESAAKHIIYGSSQSPRMDTIEKIASALGVSVQEITGDQVDQPKNQIPLMRVPVIGKVQAGLWQDALEIPFNERYSISIPDVGDYPGLPRYGLKVAGDSMNRVFPEGTTVVIINFSDLGRLPRYGEYVVAERRCPDRDCFEATVKAVEIRGDGSVLLWPKSTNPEFQTPIELLSGGWEDGDGWGVPDVIIKGLVVAVYQVPTLATF
ncbi:MAG: S24 family peptidase [Acetobacter okinawensis]|uniref:helix-turn-helix domain-containing protein n=1 Tax=Acetobacter okinawensis TaxID=1076594 RepID=UPI0039EC5870